MGGRRIGITGIGCLPPNGTGREANARALARGKSGIDRLCNCTGLGSRNSTLVVARGA